MVPFTEILGFGCPVMGVNKAASFNLEGPVFPVNSQIPTDVANDVRYFTRIEMGRAIAGKIGPTARFDSICCENSYGFRIPNRI